jgi:hypothetical protein
LYVFRCYRPTFKFYKNGIEIAELIGAEPENLRDLVKQHAGTPEESGSNSLNVQGHVSERYISFNSIFSQL